MIIHDVEQGTPEWLAARCGILTASEMKLILTPTLKVANNDKTRQHVYELLSQRINNYVEPQYIGDEMLRGYEDEITARDLYNERFDTVNEVGFITEDKWGFTIGYSPDGLVRGEGLIECKSRRQKYQTQTIIEWEEKGEIPQEYMMQIQTGLLVTGREWCDLISYCAGMPMTAMRVFPDPDIQAAILEAAEAFEATIEAKHEIYSKAIALGMRMVPTERKDDEEEIII